MDSRLTILAVTDNVTNVWLTEFPQNVDVFMGMDKHRIWLWERWKNETVVSGLT